MPNAVKKEAVTCLLPDRPILPVVFDSPHSGDFYPPSFHPAVPLHLLRRMEDRFVDELFADAPRHGATLIAARFARCFIDPNRRLSDLDVTLLDEPWPGAVSPGRLSERGVGLIFRRVADDVEIYDRRLGVAEIKERIDRYWHPYHDALGSALDDARARHGVVWHINCHSMLPVGDDRSPDPGEIRADFVLGDRNGAACDGRVTNLVAATLQTMGYSVALNDPYTGAELVRKHGQPDAGRNSLQIEINRRLYLNLDTLEKNERFSELRVDLGRLAAEICAYARSQLHRSANYP